MLEIMGSTVEDNHTWPVSKMFHFKHKTHVLIPCPVLGLCGSQFVAFTTKSSEVKCNTSL